MDSGAEGCSFSATSTFCVYVDNPQKSGRHQSHRKGTFAKRHTTAKGQGLNILSNCV